MRYHKETQQMDELMNEVEGIFKEAAKSVSVKQYLHE